MAYEPTLWKKIKKRRESQVRASPCDGPGVSAKRRGEGQSGNSRPPGSNNRWRWAAAQTAMEESVM